jgi:hypothetical protein
MGCRVRDPPKAKTILKKKLFRDVRGRAQPSVLRANEPEDVNACLRAHSAAKPL